MSDMRDRLLQLLDGELDPSDIANDASLISLADRLYGIKIAPVKPVKARDFIGNTPTQPITEIAPPTDMMIEIIEPLAAPIGNLPHLEMPNLPSVNNGRRKIIKFLSVSGLLAVIANLFGLLSYILGPICDIDQQCRGSEQTRINWMSIHKIGSSEGWSYSLLGNDMSGVGGSIGGMGIPDIVAILVFLSATIFLFRKK